MITPLHLLQFEETSRAKKVGPSPRLAIQIHFTPEMRKKKTARYDSRGGGATSDPSEQEELIKGREGTR